MDVGVWLNDLQCLYNNLSDMDPTAITDRAFVLIAIGNLPLKDPDWRSFAVVLRQCINQYDAVRPKPMPIRSKEFTSAICEEHIFRNRDNPDVQAHVFTTTLMTTRNISRINLIPHHQNVHNGTIK